jgi:hypothetical protein
MCKVLPDQQDYDILRTDPVLSTNLIKSFCS